MADWLAGADAVGTGAWLPPALALLIALAGRRRLPPGVPEGLFIAGLSAALLQNYALAPEWGEPGWLLQVGAALLALALLWLLAGRWVESVPAAAQVATDPVHLVRRTLGVHAAIIAGLLATAAAVAALWTTPGPGHGRTLALLIPLLALSAGAAILRRSGELACSALAILLMIARLVLPPATLAAHRGPLAAGLLALAAAALLAAVGAMLHHWRVRTRIARDAPDRLADPPPAYRRTFSAAVVLAAACGAAAPLIATAPLTPLALAAAALAVLTAGHWWRSNPVGALGLALAGGTAVTVPAAWLPGGASNLVLGWALAGAWLVWLSRFWEQQLDAGRPWTTAGRLVPTAARLGCVAAAAAAVWCAAGILAGPWAPAPRAWVRAAAGALLLAQWLMLGRQARRTAAAGLALGAVLALAGALATLHGLVAAGGRAMAPPVLIAAGGLLLALRAGGRRPSDGVAWVDDAWIGGIVPLAAAQVLLLGGAWPPGAGRAALTAGLVVAALVLRRVRRGAARAAAG